MLIKLKRNWFSPEGIRYRSKDRSGGLFIQTVPDDLLKDLPSETEVFDANYRLIGTVKAVREGAVGTVDDEAAKKDLAVKSAQEAVEKAKEAVEAAEKKVEAADTPAKKAAETGKLNNLKNALAEAETNLKALTE